MAMEEQHEADVVVLALRGRLRAGEGAALYERLEDLCERGHRQIVVDLAEVSTVDSAGLGELVRCYTTVSRRHGTLKVRNLTKRVTDLLSATRLFELTDDDDDWPTGAAGTTSLGAVFNIKPKS